MKRWCVTLVVLWQAMVAVHAADGRNLAVQSSGRRVALVIGNDAYRAVPELNNARADARAIAGALERVGFQVTLKLDTDLGTLKSALRNFKAQVGGGDEALFFYSGHGVQLGATNYLLPIDIKGDSEDQVKDDAVPLQRVLDDLQEQKARFTLAIIDACRNNPFKTTGRAIGGRGLAPTTAATGQMVLYSAGTGQQALDRLGNKDGDPNGVFTRVFLREMNRPGVPVSEVLRNVREQVVDLARSVGHEQVPALYDQSLGRFYFRPGEAGAAPAPAIAVSPPLTPAPARSAAQIEDELWEGVRDSDKAAVFEEYLRQYPKGRYTAQARVKLAGLRSGPSRPAPALPAAGQEDGETALWKAVDGGGQRDDYQTYLAQYPKGKYIALARARLKKLDDEAAAAAAQKEQDAWQAAEGAGSEDAYQAYLRSYPSGRYAALVPARLTKARAEARLQEEEAAWKRALAGASRASMLAYLDKYPDGRYVATAREKEEEYKRVPPRPQIPVAVGEDIWKTIEASEAYRNLPRPKAIKVSYNTSAQMEYTGAKNRFILSTPAPTTQSWSREVQPIGDRCSVHKMVWSGADGKSYGAGGGSYVCGFVSLGSMADGKMNGYTKSIDELKGSLFPMRTGAKLSLRVQNAYVPDRKFDSSHSSACEVMEQVPARSVHPRLSGAAWRIHCQGSYVSNYNNTVTATETDDYYLEDLGVMVSAIGVLNMEEKKFVIPQPGHKTVMVAEGDYGSRTTTTYASFNWSVDGMPSEVATAAKVKETPPAGGGEAKVGGEGAVAGGVVGNLLKVFGNNR